MKYSICNTAELPELQWFISDHWSRGHILSFRKGLMDFQHGTDTGYNFVLGRKQGKLVGILGFIPINRYDVNDNGIWLAMWKSLEPGMGMGMLKYLENLYHPDSIGAIGINPEVSKLYDTIGYQTGKLTHYIFNGEWGARADLYPMRPWAYMMSKYVHHPYRHYLVKITHGICYVYRRIEEFARIVDIFQISDKTIHSNGIDQYDYFDCLCGGIDLTQAGFTVKPPDMISPIYTEPMVMENRDLLYAYKSTHPYVMFKGHSDMDRPNQ